MARCTMCSLPDRSRHDAAALLAAVLERVEPEVGDVRGLRWPWTPNTPHSSWKRSSRCACAQRSRAFAGSRLRAAGRSRSSSNRLMPSSPMRSWEVGEESPASMRRRSTGDRSRHFALAAFRCEPIAPGLADLASRARRTLRQRPAAPRIGGGDDHAARRLAEEQRVGADRLASSIRVEDARRRSGRR